MSGIKDYEHFLQNNTPYTLRYDLYKDVSIPILKDDSFNENCKEVGKQLLQNTKRPLCQNLDVIIPERERSASSKHSVKYFKDLIGKRMFRDDDRMTDNKSNGLKTPKHDTKKETPTPSPASDLANLIKELIKTEETHVQKLQDIVTHIIEPIKETFKAKNDMLEKYKFNNIYLNIATMYPVNKAFLEELQKYERKETTESVGSICKRFMPTMQIYKSFLLKCDECDHHNSRAKANHAAYKEFVMNNKLFQNNTLLELLAPIIQRMGRYSLLFKDIMKTMGPQDPDFENFSDAYKIADDICDMKYGSNSKEGQLIYLFTLIKNLPCRFLNDKRKLLGYYDCTELSLSDGKYKRPVTILVFTDKLMVVKRANSGVKSEDIFKIFEDKEKQNIELSSFRNPSQTSLKKNESKSIISNPFKKLLDYYSEFSNSLQIKGWVDIKSSEIFDGLKDRPDTFLLRTSIPDSAEDDPEAQYEDYFRKSDRLFSVIPNKAGYISDKDQEYKAKREELISLYQRQFALLNFTDDNEVFHESNFSLPAYAYIYNENSYKKSNFKNNILAVYIEDDYKIDFNDFLTDDVWALFLIHKKGKGFNISIRSKVRMGTIRDSRETEYETIVNSNQNDHGEYDFFQTLWNSVIYYERRLRASSDYANIHDTRLRARSQSRSRSRSLTKSASKLKLFSRSRSSSPTRTGSFSSSNEHSTISTNNTSTFNSSVAFKNNSGSTVYNPASNDAHVTDPFLKVASMNKKPVGHPIPGEIPMQNQYQHHPRHNRRQSDLKATLEASLSTPAYLNYDSPTPPSLPPYDHNRRDSFDFNLIDKNAGVFIDQFNDLNNARRRPEESMYGGCNTYQDNSRQSYGYSSRTNSSQFYGSATSINRPGLIDTGKSSNRPSLFDIEASYYHHSNEPLSRPPSGGGNSSSSATSTSDSPTSITSSTSTSGMAMHGNISNSIPFSRGLMDDYERPDYFDKYSNNSINEEMIFDSFAKKHFPRKFQNRASSNGIPPSMMYQPYQQREHNRPGIPQFNSPHHGGRQSNASVDQLNQVKQDFNSMMELIIQYNHNVGPEEIRELHSDVMSRLDEFLNGRKLRHH